MNLLLNLLFAFLAFFGTRYLLSMVMPAGENREQIVTIVAVIVAVVVFLANFAARVQT